jgi:hypothetical protein
MVFFAAKLFFFVACAMVSAEEFAGGFAALAPAHPARPATSNAVVIMRNEYAFMFCLTRALSYPYLERCAGPDLRDFQVETARHLFLFDLAG